jgi:SAM-dependent methyltransferase
MTSSNDIPIYQTIGVGYNLTRCADPEIVAKIASFLDIKPDQYYLDLACGTGNYTLALANRGGIWTGIDCSSVMVREAITKSSQITWQVAHAEELPCDHDSFDGAIITLAIHHFADPVRVFKGLARTLKPGSPLVLFTSTAEQMQGYWLNHYFPVAMQRSIMQMPTRSHTLNYLQQGGLIVDQCEPYFVSPHLQDLFLYSGKHRPKMYLDRKIRQGSSTFANLASPDEVAQGCTKLADDIRSGHFNEIFRQYENTNGDYLFIRVIGS